MRDFTYIDDLVHGVRLLIDANPRAVIGHHRTISKVFESKSTVAPYRVVNIGNSKPEKLIDFIEAIEKAVGIEAVKKFHANAGRRCSCYMGRCVFA